MTAPAQSPVQTAARNGVTVRKVDAAADFETFLRFPWTLYKGDPNWVPPLVSSRRKLLDKTKNPSWEYLKGDYFIAYKDNTPVGTIAAFINPRHNDTWQDKTAFFGCFECIDDQTVADALLTTAIDHVRTLGTRDYDTLRGPMTFTVNDEIGLPLDAFDQPPMILMPYGKSYYPRLVETSSVQPRKAMDLVSYYIAAKDMVDAEGNYPRDLTRITDLAMKRYDMTYRWPDASKLKEELQLLREVYEAGWEQNWGNVKPTDHEMDHLFADLKDYFAADLGVFVYVKGEVAGFFMALPDMNQVLIRAQAKPSEPELLTMIKALWHWKLRPKITGCRVLLFGVKPEFRNKGVDAVCFLKFFEAMRKTKYAYTDAGWILETNDGVRKLGERVGARVYKNYRVYDISIPPRA